MIYRFRWTGLSAINACCPGVRCRTVRRGVDAALVGQTRPRGGGPAGQV